MILLLLVKMLVWLCLTALGAATAIAANSPPGCTLVPCAFSTNIAYDAAGDPDHRPSTWGNAAYVDSKVPFVNVPKGYRVRVIRVYGDHVAWPHGSIVPGTFAGVLFGILATGAGQSPFVGPALGSSGCSVYIQQAVGSVGARAPFDFDVAAAGLLGDDHVMTLRQSVWLNETGVSIHMEVSMVVVFKYVKI